MNDKLSMVMRSVVVTIAAACTSGDDPVAGAGAGGGPVVEGASPACVQWAKAFNTCSAGDLDELLEGCLNFGPCQAEAEDYWVCSTAGLQKNCDPSCPQKSGALDYCMLTAATCEVEENSCSCVGETFKPDNLYATCEFIDAEPAGGAGAGGGGNAGGGAVAEQIVQCTCGYGDTLSHICQQEALDCGLGTGCCWKF